MSDLYLIDAMALAYRGHFAFIRNPLRNSKGMNTSALFSFLSALLKIIEDEKAEHLVVALDSDRETFRREIYKEYKAHRPPMPDELKEQIPYLFKLLKAMNIPVIQTPGIEADDLIGTLAVRTAAQGGRAFIISKDKDFGQLVNDRIQIVDPKRRGETTERMGPKEIEAKFGIPPERMVDYLALMGDASDNIPGVPKVGPKTAVDLIKRFGGIDEIYANLDKIEQKGLRKNLEENRESAFLSQKLVRIKTDLEIPEDPFTFGPVGGEEYAELLKELEFKEFLKAATPVAKKPEAVNYRAIDSEAALAAFIKEAAKAEMVAVDTETDGVDAHHDRIAGISLSFKEFEAVYVPIHHANGKNLALAAVQRLLNPILESETIVKAGHNLKFDLAVLSRHGFNVKGPLFDTMVAAYVLSPGTRQYGLDDCMLDRFSHAMTPITDLIGEKKKDQIVFSAVEIGPAADYSCADADCTLRLATHYGDELRKQGLWKLFYEIEMPLLKVLLTMESDGIRIDRDFLKTLSLEYDKKLESLQGDILRSAGRDFNFNSPKQLQEILFNELKIKPLRKIKTGFSTDSDVLEVLAREHELPRLILIHRQFTKLKSTYVDALPESADEGGFVHTSFNQTVTATGRLSSSDPNLQNIPVRSDEGREIRRAFVPRKEGHVLVSCDYSQIELRILAHISDEATMIESFLADEDIHRRTASLIFNTLPALVSSEQRAMAKTVNFGIVYGQGAYGLSQQIGVSQKEAKEFIDNYFKTYPKILSYMETTKNFARDKGYVETLFGRRRYLPDINSGNHQVMAFAERTAINTPIQGTAADLIKIAMVRVQAAIEAGRLPCRLLLQVHDELVVETPAVEADGVIRALKAEMEGAASFKVPLKVDAGQGLNWLEAHA